MMKLNSANRWEVTLKELVKLCDGEYFGCRSILLIYI
ncbi:MAG: hypothetical protein PARBA_04082 [Parabacteroides sp.]